MIYTSRGEELVFEFYSEEGIEMEKGTGWRLVAFLEGKTEITPISGSEITLLFEGGVVGESGRVSGSAGCYRYNSANTFDGSTFRFGPAVSTRMACMDPPGVMEQEGRFLAWLEEAVSYRVEGDRLYLQTGDGRGFVFVEVREN